MVLLKLFQTLRRLPGTDEVPFAVINPLRMHLRLGETVAFETVAARAQHRCHRGVNADQGHLSGGFGDVSGGTINVAVKSGTNELHGGVSNSCAMTYQWKASLLLRRSQARHRSGIESTTSPVAPASRRLLRYPP